MKTWNDREEAKELRRDCKSGECAARGGSTGSSIRFDSAIVGRMQHHDYPVEWSLLHCTCEPSKQYCNVCRYDVKRDC